MQPQLNERPIKIWIPLKSAKIKLENGKTISIEAKNQSPKNVYVQKILLNGKRIISSIPIS